MTYTHTIQNVTTSNADFLEGLLNKQGWKTQKKISPEGQLIAAQKGAWSRTGVYIVHASILIIFLGAIVGYFTGFKGSVMIPETKQTDKVYTTETHTPIELGFTVRCDMFEIEFYDNGMPKEYRSRLTVFENDKEVLVKDIEVNHPLKYRGITFYQSSYEGYRDFLITLTDPANGSKKTFVVPFQQQVSWEEKGIVLGIVNAEAIRDRVVRMKVWVQSGTNPPETFWLDTQAESTLKESNLPYTISAKQMYATGLQVAKDPGVWLVYLGCFLMMFGLYVAFFMSHARVWVITYADGSNSTLLVAGTTNKNKIGFEKTFSQLITSLTEKCH